MKLWPRQKLFVFIRFCKSEPGNHNLKHCLDFSFVQNLSPMDDIFNNLSACTSIYLNYWAWPGPDQNKLLVFIWLLGDLKFNSLSLHTIFHCLQLFLSSQGVIYCSNSMMDSTLPITWRQREVSGNIHGATKTAKWWWGCVRWLQKKAHWCGSLHSNRTTLRRRQMRAGQMVAQPLAERVERLFTSWTECWTQTCQNNQKSDHSDRLRKHVE